MQFTFPVKIQSNSDSSRSLEGMARSFCFVDNKISVRLIALLSFSLSLSIILFDPVINRDGILYFFTAETFLHSGFGAALEVYPWPFFPILIAAVSEATSLPLVHSSHIIVTLCFFVTCYAFTRMVAEMGGSRTAQLFGLIIITFHPLLADYRSSSVRDPGMWGFMLLSMLALLRYSKHPSLIHQLSWVLFVTIAFLFRIEAFVIALISPVALLFIGKSNYLERIKNTVRFYSIPAAIFFAQILLFLSFSPEPADNFKFLKDLNYYSNYLLQLSNIISAKSVIISEELLAHTAKDDSVYAVLSIFLGIFVLNVARAITPVYLVLLLHNLLSRSKLQLDHNANAIIGTVVSILAVYLFSFTILRQFNLERYSFQIAILLMLYLPFILERLWMSTSYRGFFRPAIVVVLGLYTADSFINSDYKKAYINDAAEWLQTEMNGNKKVVSNHSHIAFFANDQKYRLDSSFPKKTSLKGPFVKNNIYAYYVKDKEEELLRKRIKKQKAKIIKEFKGSENGVVIVFENIKAKKRRKK